MNNEYLNCIYPDLTKENIYLGNEINIYHFLKKNIKKFKCNNFLSPYSGFYGYFSYNSISYFEKIKFYSTYSENRKIPEIRLVFFKNLVVFNHITKEISIITHKFNEKLDNNYTKLMSYINNKKLNTSYFKTISTFHSNIKDSQYKKLVSKGIKLCLIGDVFQIVLSRYYKQKFKGDEFNVYRVLRDINPSPYLFYFDYVNYKLFGSSPESQVLITNKKASLYPLAGTLSRTKNPDKKNLLKSNKENSEHIMLVDLSRNDLNKNTLKVKIEKYKKREDFSHVIHMVSKVSGKLPKLYTNLKIFGASFPAGTLSGSPKYRAMELIDKIEIQSRVIYGGALGFLGIKGSINLAIIIRSFLSKKNLIFTQAGAGIVSKSKEENELKEIKNKLSALNKSIYLAKKIC